MTKQPASQSQRIAWLEGIRIFAAIFLLLYHAQLLLTGYAYTPTPTGLLDNLQRMVAPIAELGRGPLFSVLALPSWFGFQFVDVFVLISGFSLVLSLRGKPLDTGSFLKRRILRILWPLWTVAWLSYPVLWAIGKATDSYIPHPWHIFAGATFPLVFDYSGELLLHTSGPWWFVPLILSFAALFPFLWYLLRRWGENNFLIVSLVTTIVYRFLATYPLNGHPTYVIVDTAADWQPFVLFVSKLSTFAIGMVIGQQYTRNTGPLFWNNRQALLVGVPLYLVGFVCQFYRPGWVVVDLLLPLGLTLCCMVVFRTIAQPDWMKPALIWLGAHSYSYFLLHNFVVDRTVKLVVRDDVALYWKLLPAMLAGTLILAVIVDSVTPLLRGFISGILRDLDYVMSRTPQQPQRSWKPQVGDVVLYRGKGNWRVLKLEKLLDEQEFFLCQISDGTRSVWVNEEELKPSEKSPRSEEATRKSAFP